MPQGVSADSQNERWPVQGKVQRELLLDVGAVDQLHPRYCTSTLIIVQRKAACRIRYSTGARSTGGCNLDRALRAAPPSRVHVSFELLYVAYFFDLLALSCPSMQMEMYKTKLTKGTSIMRTVARPLSGSAMIWKHAAVDTTADDHVPRRSQVKSLRTVCVQ